MTCASRPQEFARSFLSRHAQQATQKGLLVVYNNF